MLAAKFIREHREKVLQNIQRKRERADLEAFLAADERRRSVLQEVEQLKSTRNTVSGEIAKAKKQGQDASSLIEEMQGVSARIKQLDDEVRTADEAMETAALYIPNMLHQSVPTGATADDNIVVRQQGETMEQDFRVEHVEFCKRHGLVDFERGAKLSGSGFALYTGRGAALERALINFMTDFHVEKHGYTEVFPPFVVNAASMRGTGQIPKMADDMYRCADDDLYLIPTAEVPITNIYRDEILTGEELTKKICGFSACFRREAGSYGKDTRGFLRLHQFQKVELVKFAKPEDSYDELESLVSDVEAILSALGIVYRVILLCSGDTSFSSAKTYDIEVWSPCENKWLEASSCSNFEDFQARRASIRFRRTPNEKPEFVHTLNGSGLATSRLMVALLEQFQTPEGGLIVPEVLRPYCRFDSL